MHSNLAETRLGAEQSRNMKFSRSPNIDEKPLNKIKREGLKNEFNSCEYNNAYSKSPKTLADDKPFNSKMNHNSSNCRGGDAKSNANIKREQIKMENGIGKLATNDDFTEVNNPKKRASSANSSPYKDKKRKKLNCEDQMMDHQLMPPTNHDRLGASLLPPPAPIYTKYFSYFDCINDEKEDIG